MSENIFKTEESLHIHEDPNTYESSVFTIKTEKLTNDELLSVYSTDFKFPASTTFPPGVITSITTAAPVVTTNIAIEEISTDTKKLINESKPTTIYCSNAEFNLNNFDCGTTILNLDTQKSFKTPRCKWNESPEARKITGCRQRRLLRNAQRMREKRSQETPEQYRARLKKNAEANRLRRQNETEVQRAIRLMKNAERQRLKRASETPEERAKRLKKSAERMRNIRAQQPKLVKPNLADRLIGY